jgi:hypothetical protein
MAENTEMIVKPAQTSTVGSIPSKKSLLSKLGSIEVGCEKARSALLFSLRDGVFANGMLAFTETFSVATAVYLKTPAVLISLLGSLPLLLCGNHRFFRFLLQLVGRLFIYPAPSTDWMAVAHFAPCFNNSKISRISVDVPEVSHN